MFVEAVLWIALTGAPWRDLPEEFGNWYTVYTRFRRWARKGVWEHIFQILSDDPDLEYVLLDATHIRVHQHGIGAKGGTRNQAIGKSRGGLTTKIAALVDALGNLVRFVLLPGQRHDIVSFDALMAGIACLASSATRRSMQTGYASIWPAEVLRL
jgi:transposase